VPQNTDQDMNELNKFLDFAFANKSVEGKIICLYMFYFSDFTFLIMIHYYVVGF